MWEQTNWFGNLSRLLLNNNFNKHGQGWDSFIFPFFSTRFFFFQLAWSRFFYFSDKSERERQTDGQDNLIDYIFKDSISIRNPDECHEMSAHGHFRSI